MVLSLASKLLKSIHIRIIQSLLVKTIMEMIELPITLQHIYIIPSNQHDGIVNIRNIFIQGRIKTGKLKGSMRKEISLGKLMHIMVEFYHIREGIDRPIM